MWKFGRNLDVYANIITKSYYRNFLLINNKLKKKKKK